jgi:hypothetical protein
MIRISKHKKVSIIVKGNLHEERWDSDSLTPKSAVRRCLLRAFGRSNTLPVYVRDKSFRNRNSYLGPGAALAVMLIALESLFASR